MSDISQKRDAYKKWLDSNPDQKGSEKYQAVQQAFLASGGRSDEVQAIKDALASGETTTLERAGMPVAYAYYKGKEMLKSAGVKGVPALAGQAVGQRFGKVGERVGAGLGALAGSVTDQIRRGEDIRIGETVADVTAAVANPRSVAGAALTSAGASTVGQLIDEGTVNPASVAAATAIGGTGGMLARGKTPKPVLKEPDANFLYRYQAFNDVKKYGVKVNPQELERGSEAFNNFAGSAAMSATASKGNQNAWQIMAREAGGLPTSKAKVKNGSLAFEPATRRFGVELEDGEIAKAIKDAAGPYKEIDEISKTAAEEARLLAEQKLKNGKFVTSFTTAKDIDTMISASDNMERLKSLRKQKKKELAGVDSGDPMAYDRLQALKVLEGELEDKIEAAAIASGKEGLKDQLIAARRKIAVLHAIDNATESYGLVSPRKLSVMRSIGEPITGNLEKMALFYDAFSPSAQGQVVAGMTNMPGVAANYTARNVMMGNTSGILSGGFPVISEAARSYILRDAAQTKYAQPRYELPKAGISEAGIRQLSMMLAQQADNADKKARK